MTKVSEHDLVREHVPVQEFAQEVITILNRGGIEIEVTSASSPAYDAPNETKLVLSLFGSQYRFYISYLGQWYWVSLTAL